MSKVEIPEFLRQVAREGRDMLLKAVGVEAARIGMFSGLEATEGALTVEDLDRRDRRIVDGFRHALIGGVAFAEALVSFGVPLCYNADRGGQRFSIKRFLLCGLMDGTSIAVLSVGIVELKPELLLAKLAYNIGVNEGSVALRALQRKFKPPLSGSGLDY